MAQQVYRLFGIDEETLRERLQDVLCAASPVASLSFADGEGCLRLTAEDADALAAAGVAVKSRVGAFITATEYIPLVQRVVTLRAARGKTVATAESCTGGLLASRLTAVSGASQVFGTGIVSYSWDCKKQLLGVSPQTLESTGAVSAETAREMANGARRRGDADLGVAITGEAGPHTAEDKPVGTVFVALADKRRCWVKELHLDGDRAAIRRAASSHALDMVRRYLEAYPTVMAGGEKHGDYAARHQQPSPETAGKRLMTAVLPWRGTRRLRAVKIVALIAALAILASGVLLVSNYLAAPANNRELQGDLAELYWDTTADLTEETPSADGYPDGMKAQFRGLYDLNSDIAAWVRIPDTAINYPVTLYADGYYDNHNFNDQYSIYGQPHFDAMNERAALATDHVLAIHGNNTRDEQMFSSLLSYRRIAYLREHPLVEMNTLYGDAKWQVFAVAVVDERERTTSFDYLRRDFASDAAYETYLYDLQRRSLFTTDAKPTTDDTVLLLVTDASQEYGFSGARLVVAAKRVDTAETVDYTHNAGMKWPAAYPRRTTARPVATTVKTARPTTVTTVTTAATTARTTTSTTAVVTTTQTTTMTVATSTTVPSTTTTTALDSVETATTTTTAATADGDADNADRENTDDDHLGN